MLVILALTCLLGFFIGGTTGAAINVLIGPHYTVALPQWLEQIRNFF